MITQIDKRTLDFLVKKKLTFNQFCMCLMIYHEDVAGIIKYTDQVGFLTGGTIIKPDGSKVNELNDLIKRGYLAHTIIDEREPYNLDNYTVTDKFIKGFLDRFDEYAKELWAEYPKEGKIGNHDPFPAKSVDFDEFKEKYIKILKEDIDEHEVNITRLREYKKQHQYAEMGIMKYIGSRHWQNLSTDGKPKIRLY